MKLLEIAAMVNTQLSIEQQECLLRMYMGKDADPIAAMQTISGNVKLMAAAEYLIKTQMLQPVASGYVISQKGTNELITLGIVDNGGVTDVGRTLLGQPAPKPHAAQPQSAPSSVSAATSS